jgi:hypothetical protein
LVRPIRNIIAYRTAGFNFFLRNVTECGIFSENLGSLLG